VICYVWLATYNCVSTCLQTNELIPAMNLSYNSTLGLRSLLRENVSNALDIAVRDPLVGSHAHT